MDAIMNELYRCYDLLIFNIYIIYNIYIYVTELLQQKDANRLLAV